MTIIGIATGASTGRITMTGTAIDITTEAGTTTITITPGVTTIMGIGIIITTIAAHCSRSSFAKADSSD